MTLNDLIFNRLASNEELAGLLASYADAPAIFNGSFPADEQDGWGGKGQYPRIAYQFNMQIDPQRNSSGFLQLYIYTMQDPVTSEKIENLVRRSLEGVLMKPTGEAPFCTAWYRTDPYMVEGSPILTRALVFDIFEYPDQETTDPDPAIALSNYIKEVFPEAIVLGIDRLAEYTETAEEAVFYVRLDSLQLDPDGFCQQTIRWFIARLGVHLLCPNAAARIKIIAGLNQMLACADDVNMMDNSPMTIRNMSIDNRADYLRVGQLTVTGHYGCLVPSNKGKSVVGIGLSDSFSRG